MKRLQKNKLIINRRIIVSHLTDLEGVLDYLIAKQVITPALRNRINQNFTPADRIRQFLDCLIDCKPPLVFQYFLEALVLTGNSSIADVLEPNYSSSDSCRRLIELEQLTVERHVSSNNNQIVFNPNSNTNNRQINNLNEQNLQYPIACTQPDASSNTFNILYSSEPPPVQNFLRNHNLSSPLFYGQRNSYHYHPQFVRDNSSSRGSTNSSMSPNMSRTRSSSVNATISSIRQDHTKNGLYSNSRYRNFNKNSFDETISASSSSNSSINGCNKLVLNKLPIPVSDQDNQLNNQLPCTYNIDWTDVNNLELDFNVHKSWPPNLKQLSPNECYQMDKEPRGICVIINNENFFDDGKKNDELRRHGTDMDASRLRNLFEKLKFRVDMHVDLTEIKMRQAINNLANEANLNANNFDAICLIVLTHGSDGYLHGIDLENKINIDFILNIFDDVLIGKPKLFIFQACRGEYLNQKDMNMLTTTTTNCKTELISSSSSSNINLEIIHQEESKLITQNTPYQQSTSSQFKSLPTPPVTPNTPNTPKTVSQILVSNDIEETVKNFRNIKLSSGSHQASKEMMFKKNTNKSCKNLKNMVNDNDSPSPKKISSNTGFKKIRSRSHSRSKYTSYIASAATALFSAIKTSPNHLNTKNTISTQTSIENANVNKDAENAPIEITSSGLCYTDVNIYELKKNTQSLINFIDGRPIKTSLPSRSDFFIWYSSVRGFVSHRDPDGSPFIKCLVTVFSRCAYELELVEMVRKVNFLMQQYEKKHMNERNSVAYYFMVPVVEYHLTKRLYFNP